MGNTAKEFLLNYERLAVVVNADPTDAYLIFHALLFRNGYQEWEAASIAHALILGFKDEPKFVFPAINPTVPGVH